MSKSKFCPINGLRPCVEEKCAWWWDSSNYESPASCALNQLGELPELLSEVIVCLNDKSSEN